MASPRAHTTAATAKHLVDANVFLSPSGSDRNACTQAAPCATFNRASQVAKPGDTVCVAAGSYGEQWINPRPGQRTPNVVFQSCGGTATIFALRFGGDTLQRPCCMTFKNLTITGSDTTYSAVRIFAGGTDPATTAHDLVFDHDRIAVGQPTEGPVFGGGNASNLTIKNSTIGPACCGNKNLGGGAYTPNDDVVGIRVGAGNDGLPVANNLVVENNLIQGITRNCALWIAAYGPCPQPSCNDGDYCHQDGIQVWGVHNMHITRNRFYNNQTQGIYVTVEGANSDNTIENNMILQSEGIAIQYRMDGPTSGFHNIRFNSTPNGIVIGDFRGVQPGTVLNLVGNTGRALIVNQTGDDAGCAGYPRDRMTINYLYNAWAQPGTNTSSCSSTDLNRARQSFLNTAVAPANTADLHLAHPWVGEDYVPTSVAGGCPTTDIDGDARPHRTKCDVGADQWETAAFVPGKSIGRLRIGQRADEVRASYGRPRKTKAWVPVRKGQSRRATAGLKIASYRRHRGSVWAIYDHQTIVGLGTTNPYYSTADGLGVGSSTKGFRPSLWVDCRHAYRIYRHGLATFYATDGGKQGGKIVSISMLVRKYEYC